MGKFSIAQVAHCASIDAHIEIWKVRGWAVTSVPGHFGPWSLQSLGVACIYTVSTKKTVPLYTLP